MNIKQISFTNFHTVGTKVYNLNETANYFVGPNGAGKSTILQAIQLALLGYVPGYAKTNEGIMKHCLTNNMQVSIVLDGEEEVTITRDWTCSGTSVKSNLTVFPEEYDISGVLNEIELPIFNFNEFTGLTANKLKEWFIKFLPNEGGEIDWEKELRDALADTNICTDALLESTLDSIKGLDDGSKSGVDLVSSVNAELKNSLSFNKGQLQRLQGTIDSLIFYNDIDEISDEALIERREELTKLRADLLQWENNYKPLRQKISALELPAEDENSDPEFQDLTKRLLDLEGQEDELTKQITQVQSDAAVLSHEYNHLASIKGYTCPYTSQECDSIKGMYEENMKKAQEIRAQYDALREKIAELNSEKSKIECDLIRVRGSRDELSSKYRSLSNYRSMLADAPESAPTDMSVAEIDEELESIYEALKKIAANKKFNEFNDKLTSEKFELENTIKCLNEWIKLTGANGLQTQLIAKPFESLREDMTAYLTTFFDEGVEAAFNLSEKNNSFSFGISRGGKYVEYSNLSSGEKCLYTLAMMNCLLKGSGCDLQVIIVDDLLDHLDQENADRLFESLLKPQGTQYILAGVKPCASKDLCKEV